MIKLLDILKEAEEQQYKIYCDMDGVLVDFDRGYKDLTHMTPREAEALGMDKFWEPLDKAGIKFWANLKWMPDGKALWDYIKPHNPELLSAPSNEESSKIGKYVWVKRNLPGVKLILRRASQKRQFANTNAILIDDRGKNIDEWRESGGIGIKHTSAADTIKQLRELGIK